MDGLLNLSPSKINQLWAEVKDYFVDWEKVTFGEPLRRSLKSLKKWKDRHYGSTKKNLPKIIDTTH